MRDTWEIGRIVISCILCPLQVLLILQAVQVLRNSGLGLQAYRTGSERRAYYLRITTVIVFSLGLLHQVLCSLDITKDARQCNYVLKFAGWSYCLFMLSVYLFLCMKIIVVNTVSQLTFFEKNLIGGTIVAMPVLSILMFFLLEGRILEGTCVPFMNDAFGFTLASVDFFVNCTYLALFAYKLYQQMPDGQVYETKTFAKVLHRNLTASIVALSFSGSTLWLVSFTELNLPVPIHKGFTGFSMVTALVVSLMVRYTTAGRKGQKSSGHERDHEVRDIVIAKSKSETEDRTVAPNLSPSQTKSNFDLHSTSNSEGIKTQEPSAIEIPLWNPFSAGASPPPDSLSNYRTEDDRLAQSGTELLQTSSSKLASMSNENNENV